MAARYCVECGNLVTTAFCPSCGAIQPTQAEPAGSDETQRIEPPAQSDPSWAQFADRPGAGQAPAGEQPWHPFEQPSWYPGDADPRAQSSRGWDQPGAGNDFMGVSSWQPESAPIPTPPDRRRNWILGGLAALAVVVVLGIVAFLVITNESEDATPSQPSGTASAATTLATSAPDSATAAPPAVTTTEQVTTTESTSESPSTDASTEPSTASESTATSAVDPMGGPARDIPCAPGYIVQVASAPDEPAFIARVAELRAAGQLPPDTAWANTATSCAIFAGTANSIVLYAGPFAAPYDGCAARLTAAPDSFIKGTTTDTAKQYVSCLCPTTVTTVPAITAIGQTGVWVGELQRALGNKLNYDLPDLGVGTWGVFTQPTSDAVRQFQTDKALPPTGLVDVATWQALQIAECS